MKRITLTQMFVEKKKTYSNVYVEILENDFEKISVAFLHNAVNR